MSDYPVARTVAELETTVQRYGEEAYAAAEAEAHHKKLRAQRILRAKAEGAGAVSLCETIAEADDAVADAYLARLTTAAVADASKQRIVSLREKIGAQRSWLADQRAADTLHAQVRP